MQKEKKTKIHKIKTVLLGLDVLYQFAIVYTGDKSPVYRANAKCPAKF